MDLGEAGGMGRIFQGKALRSAIPVMVSVACSSGCGLILGLDEFVDAPVETSGGTTGGGGTGGQGGSGGAGGAGGVGGAGGAGGGLGGGDAIWARIYGDANQQSAAGVAVDAAGNIFATGAFEGAINFGDKTLISAGGQDIFLTKLDQNGTALWSLQFGDASDGQMPSAIAVDAEGNAVIAGSFKGSVKFGTNTFQSTGAYDVFVAKFSPTGGHIWSKTFGGLGEDFAEDVAIDPQTGDISLIGWFLGSIDFGSGTHTTVDGFHWNVFVVKLSSATGNAIWSHDYGSNALQKGQAIASDPAGNLVIGGTFSGGTLTIGTDSLINTTPNEDDVFIAKLDSAGNASWAKRYGGSGRQSVQDVATDTTGNILLTGDFQSIIDFGCGIMLSSGNDAFVAKLDTVGGCAWSRRLGDPGNEYGTRLTIDSSGNPAITGTFTNTLGCGQTITSEGGSDIFISQLSANGDPISCRHFGSPLIDTADGIVMTPDGSGLVFLGTTSGSIDLGTGPLTSSGSADVILARLMP